jgi:hypothetical protein
VEEKDRLSHLEKTCLLALSGFEDPAPILSNVQPPFSIWSAKMPSPASKDCERPLAHSLTLYALSCSRAVVPSSSSALSGWPMSIVRWTKMKRFWSCLQNFRKRKLSWQGPAPMTNDCLVISPFALML